MISSCSGWSSRIKKTARWTIQALTDVEVYTSKANPIKRKLSTKAKGLLMPA